MSEAIDKIQRCSVRMLMMYPWFASLYLRLIRRETMAVSTMAVDGTRLFYNPEFTISLTDKQCLAVLMHETLHIALLHCYRRKHREPKRWNIACDQVVNGVLVAANITLPDGCVPPGPLGALAEELYEHITLEEMARYFPSDVMVARSSADGDNEMSEKDWRDAIASSHSLVPEYLSRMIEEAIPSTKDWRNELARFIHACRRSDTHTWTRMSRRIPGMPGWAREIESRIVICVDTSGSINKALLNAFMAECRAITSLAGITAVIISADAAVSQTILPGEPFPSELGGGGGTDFEPALTEAVKHEPDCVIYFTDGDGEFPTTCPLHVLWALTKHCSVPFGEKIILEVL
jgi:predicted metal-dependent peptidase